MKSLKTVSSRIKGSLIEPLECRMTPGGVSIVTPHVLSIQRAAPAPETISTDTASFTVTFDAAVTGLDATDFHVFTAGDAKAGSIDVSGSGTTYTVTVNGLQGNGDVRLDLVDNDTVLSSTSTPLGGTGIHNGSFAGDTYHLLQVAPKVSSIVRAGSNPTGGPDVSWTVTFSEAVQVSTVDANDFTTVVSNATSTGLTVVPGTAANGLATSFTVTANGVALTGSNATIAINLADNATIKDGSGNPLQTTVPSLAPGQTASVGLNPVAIATGDLNGDGAADLVTANYSSNTVTVLLGDGRGGFTSRTDANVGISPSSLTVADVNGDGVADVVVSDYTSGAYNVTVLLGSGDGTFQAPATYRTHFNFTHGGIAVGDLNGDGKPDIVQTFTSGVGFVGVLLGNSNGTFDPAPFFPSPVGDDPRAILIADIDGDGKADVVTADYGSNQVTVLRGNGDGSFQPGVHLATGLNPITLTAADLNGDGKVDLAVGNNGYSQGTVSVLLNTASGTGSINFAPHVTYLAGANGDATNPIGVAATDIDGDGHLDLVVASGFSSGGGAGIPAETAVSGSPVAVLIGNGDGTFNGPLSFDSAGVNANGLVIADFDGDGRSDVATVNAGSGNVSVLLNTGTSPFAGPAYDIVGFDLAVDSVSNGVNTGVQTNQSLTYTVNYSNPGGLDATGVTLSVQLDANVYFDPAENPGWSHLGGQVVKTLSGTVHPGDMGSESLILHTNKVLTPYGSGLYITAYISDDGTHGADTNSNNNYAYDYDSLSGFRYNGYVVAAPGVAPGHQYAPSLIHVYDRTTGEEIYSFSAYGNYRDSIRVALGDFNFDGVDDIVTTTMRKGGKLRVFDGRNGRMFDTGPLSSEIKVFNSLGGFVAVGNVNGFGLPEIVVGSSLGGGKVRVFSFDRLFTLDSADRTQFQEVPQTMTVKDFYPFGRSFAGGVRVAVGDVDLSGGQPNAAPENGDFFRMTDDIVMGQGYFGGRVVTYAGGDLSTLFSKESKIHDFKVGNRGYIGGVSLGLGEVDNVPGADYIIGRNSGKPSIVEVFSGGYANPRDHQIGPAINPFDEDPGQPKNTFGVRVAATDVNSDGVADIIASVGIKNNSYVKIYDGALLAEGTVQQVKGFPTLQIFEDYPNVALWVAGSQFSSNQA